MAGFGFGVRAGSPDLMVMSHMSYEMEIKASELN